MERKRGGCSSAPACLPACDDGHHTVKPTIDIVIIMIITTTPWRRIRTFPPPPFLSVSSRVSVPVSLSPFLSGKREQNTVQIIATVPTTPSLSFVCQPHSLPWSRLGKIGTAGMTTSSLPCSTSSKNSDLFSNRRRALHV